MNSLKEKEELRLMFDKLMSFDSVSASNYVGYLQLKKAFTKKLKKISLKTPDLDKCKENIKKLNTLLFNIRCKTGNNSMMSKKLNKRIYLMNKETFVEYQKYNAMLNTYIEIEIFLTGESGYYTPEVVPFDEITEGLVINYGHTMVDYDLVEEALEVVQEYKNQIVK